MHTASLGRQDGLISAQVSTAHIAVPDDAVYIFSYEYLSETATSNLAVKCIDESARWADLTIRLVVKANSISAIIALFVHTWGMSLVNCFICCMLTTQVKRCPGSKKLINITLNNCIFFFNRK